MNPETHDWQALVPTQFAQLVMLHGVQDDDPLPTVNPGAQLLHTLLAEQAVQLGMLQPIQEVPP